MRPPGSNTGHPFHQRKLTRLSVEVADDGTGISSVTPIGAGLRSVREWAPELGGNCVVAPRESSGTPVRATLPVHRG